MINDYRNQTIEELKNLVTEKKKELYATSQKVMERKEKDTNKIKSLKKDIARVVTVITEKSMAASSQVEKKIKEGK